MNLLASYLLSPEPQIFDEFSYLIAADMYAKGRLSFETHPYWQHFESFMMIQEPSYSSKYFPLLGFIFALGLLISGKAIIGSCIVSALYVSVSYLSLIHI